MTKTSTTTSHKEDIKLPEGITKAILKEYWDTTTQQYRKIRRNMALLDQVDSGELWTKLCKKFPQYQIAPDTNHVNYVKENILASIYTVGKSASLIPRHLQDEELVKQINKILDNIWDVLSVPVYQQKAGERAALLNLGVTQVGWNQDIVGGTSKQWYQGDVVFKNIDPMYYARDPFSNSLDDAEYVITFEKHKLSTLRGMKEYRDALSQYSDPDDMNLPASEAIAEYSRDTLESSDSSDKSKRLVIYWIKVPDTRSIEDKGRSSGYMIHEIHTIDSTFILQVKEDIDINIFPFAELYCNEPGNDLVGQSEPAKILSSSMVTNILDGIVATHAYKAQRPPKFLNVSSGLNIRNFAKYGNDPDMTWLVNQDASKAVHYGEFPALPNEIFTMVGRLENSIKSMSGIDERYTGKETGSIQTTGGMEAMLAQSTMRDTTKINLYETYSRRLSRLVLKHLIQHADKRSYLIADKIGNGFSHLEVDFPNVDKSIEFTYALHINSHLPKTKMRMAAAADAIMEKSLQYQDPTGQTPPLMEPEEWLEHQEFPNKDIILERMQMQRTSMEAEKFAEYLSMFVQLLSSGVNPDEAFNQVMQAIEQGGLPQDGAAGGLGSTGNAASAEMGGFGGSVQARQQG